MNIINKYEYFINNIGSLAQLSDSSLKNNFENSQEALIKDYKILNLNIIKHMMFIRIIYLCIKN